MSLLANSNAIETGGYQISRSVRLRSSASGYFSRTPSASSRTTWTWTAWVKRGKLGSAQALFSAGTGTAEFRLTFTSSDTIEIYEYTSPSYNWQKITTAVYRDPSAWYQIQLVYDTTNGTAGDRVKLYVNSVQVTSFGTNTNPTVSFSGYVNSAVAHGIGSFSTGSSYLDGYLTEINFIDGQALTPSSFGETDSITGSWVAKKFTGTYGTNGFYLNFSDNSAATSTTIGKDYSGNGNNWTPNNISVTAGTTYDSMLDVPSGNGYADGGNGRGNYAVLNPLEYYLNSPTNGNLDAYSATNNSNQVSTFALPNSGKWYWEVTRTETDSTSGFSWMVGVVKTDTNKAVTTYSNANAYVYNSWDGSKYTAGSSSAYGASWRTNGDVIGCAWDADGQTLTFYKNNVSQGTAFSSLNYANGYTMIVSRTGGATASTLVTNFGQRPFSYTPPTGFKALNTTNLSDPTVKKGSSYFDVNLRTGNGSTTTVTGIPFAPDLVWVKARNNVMSHNLFDRVRGAQNALYSNLTDAETSTTNLTAFTSDGYTVGNSLVLNTYTFVDWLWKANGTGVSNTAGTITSTVSANTTSGFSIATTTGTGGAGTIGHGLGAIPQFIMSFRRNTAADHYCYHQAIGNTNFLVLNTTAASAASANLWNNTTPTSTVFSVGNTNNNSGDTYVHYIFAPIPGYSAFGSYTANASADGPFVYCGFRPRWIMLKRSSAAGAPWSMFDTSRNTYNSTNLELDANVSSAESTSGNGMDILSNGFKLRDSAYLNSSSGDTFIYAAFAENPLKFSNAR